MLTVLSKPPEASGITTKGMITKFYNEVKELVHQDSQFEIRSILARTEKAAPGRRQRQFAIVDSQRDNPYRFQLTYRKRDMLRDHGMAIYLNVSLHGDHVRFFKLETIATNEPLYWNTMGLTERLQMDHHVRDCLNNWILMCYRAIRGYTPQSDERTQESDLGVVVEFHRRYLVNQDSVCIAT